MQRFAIIRAGTVENVCLWDGNGEGWAPPEGAEVRPCCAEVAIGWRLEAGEFVPPAEAPPPAGDVLDRLAAALGVDRATLEHLASQGA